MSPVLQHIVEWYLGLPPAGAGEGTAWRFDWGPSAGAEFSSRAIVAAALMAAVIVVAIYLREAAALPWRKRLLLLTLRLAVVALLGLMLGRLSLRVDRTELPTVAVLIDTSASMGLADRYSDPALSRAARQLLPGESGRPRGRLDLVKALLTQRDGEWLRQLQQAHRVRLYAFDDHLSSLDPPDSTAVAPVGDAASAIIAELTPAGSPTALRAPLRALFDEYRGHSPAAVVVFSDGVASAGDDQRLSQAAALAVERGVPLYPIGIGSRDPARDLEVFDLMAEDVVGLGEPVLLSFRSRSFGLDGQRTEVRVTAAGSETPLATQTLTAGADRTAASIDIAFQPPAEGTYDLTISALPLPGEIDVSNNELRHRVEVRGDPLQVLLVEGRPRWEYRALKPVLERDDTVQLSTFLQSADLDFAAEDRTALRSFPATSAQLQLYDVILWGDVDLRELDRGAAERLREFVRTHGGGLLLIAGEEHNPLQYAGTPLETLLPVSLLDAEARASPTRFRLQRTLDGRACPWLRLSESPADDESLWTSLPSEMDWLIHTPQIKPGASILVTAAGVANDPPVIVQQKYGQGLILYHGVDALWTWRKRVEARHYGRYWSQAVRALAAGLRQRDDSGRELTSDRRVYAPGEEIRLRLRGGSMPPATPAATLPVRIESQAGERFNGELQRRSDGADVWEGIVRDLPLGDFKVVIVAEESQVAGATCTFRVETPDRELRDRILAEGDLQLAARISHGVYHSLAQADRVPAAIPQGRSVQLTQSQPLSLWNRWELLLLLVGLLGVEWMLRQGARLV